MSSEDNKTKYNSEITEEDKKVLGDKSRNLRQDSGDDESLKDRDHKPDFAAKDLDIPSDRNTRPLNNNRPPDEENRHHSLGSDHNENLELDMDNTKKD